MSTPNRFVKIRNLKKFFYFAIVGGFGTILNTGILYLLTSFASLNYIIASIIATETAIISNFIGNNYITFRDKDKNNHIFRKFLSFQLISLVALVGTIFFLWLFVTLFGKTLLLVWNVLAIVIMFLVNFVLNSAFTWSNKISDMNKNDIKRMEKKQNVKNILIILFLAFLILMVHPTNAVSSANSTSDTTTPLITSQAINTATGQTNIQASTSNNIVGNNTTNNQTTIKKHRRTSIQNSPNPTSPSITTAVISTANIINTPTNNVSSNPNNTLSNPTTNTASINTAAATINAASNDTINNTNNQTANNTADQTNTTINTTGNQTLNATINDTINNQTINVTNNQTNNISINNTIINITNNQTSNITSGNQTNNATINDTINNQTINVTNNQTNNISINNTIINITNNQTSNITLGNQTNNQTINITNNQTINNTTNNQTINITNNQTINNTTNNQTINITNNQTINNTINNTTINLPITSSGILSKGTDLKIISTANGTNTYYMREDSSATFYVLFNSSNTVTWFVDGVQQNAVTADNATFVWSPGILWVPRAPDFSNIALTTISAVTPNATLTWNVEVENVINPFFSDINDAADVVGSSDTKVHVFSNNNLVNFTQVNVTIVNGGGNTVYQLNKQFTSSAETDWSVYIPDVGTPGNNYLAIISGYNNVTGITLTYDIGTSRAHYKTIPAAPSGGGGGGGGRGGGGGGGTITSSIPQLIYVTLGKDVVAVNQTQTISLDAKDFSGGVQSVLVDLVTPNKGLRELQLNLTKGTKEYGTWSTEFGDFTPGQYNVSSVVLKTDAQTLPFSIRVENRSFYYTSDINIANSNLSLVYSVLDKNNVNNGTLITLTLDAKDSNGITTVNAYVINTLGNNNTPDYSFYIPLTLTSGNKDYGTWKGTFNATLPDSTYTVENITLTNAKDSKTYSINGRSVYVQAIPNLNPNASFSASSQNSILAITGAIIESPFSKQSMDTILQHPFIPTIIGFILMSIFATGIIFVSNKI